MLQLQGLVLGLVQGGTYGLIALGLVLVYKGSRVLNFAQAEVGTASLYVAWLLSGEHHLPYWVGALAAVAAAVVVGVVFERLVVRPMSEAPRLAVTVGTIGLFSFLLAGELYVFGPSPRHLEPPIAGLGLHVASVYVSPTQLLALGTVAVVATALGLVLRLTDFGLGVLAAAQDPVAVRLVGISLDRVSIFTWGVAAALGSIAALLIEPTIGIIAPGVIGEPLFVGGLAAALVGGLDSLPGALVGGLVVGVVTNEVTVSVSNAPAGLSSLVLFAIVVTVLLLRPRGLFGRLAARAEAT